MWGVYPEARDGNVGAMCSVSFGVSVSGEKVPDVP